MRALTVVRDEQLAGVPDGVQVVPGADDGVGGVVGRGQHGGDVAGGAGQVCEVAEPAGVRSCQARRRFVTRSGPPALPGQVFLASSARPCRRRRPVPGEDFPPMGIASSHGQLTDISSTVDDSTKRRKSWTSISIITSLPDRPAATTHGTQPLITPAVGRRGRAGLRLTRAGSALILAASILAASRVTLAVTQPVPAARHLVSDPADVSARGARPITEPVRDAHRSRSRYGTGGCLPLRPDLRAEAAA